MVNTVSKVPFPPMLKETEHGSKTAAIPVAIAAVPTKIAVVSAAVIAAPVLAAGRVTVV